MHRAGLFCQENFKLNKELAKHPLVYYLNNCSKDTKQLNLSGRCNDVLLSDSAFNILKHGSLEELRLASNKNINGITIGDVARFVLCSTQLLILDLSDNNLGSQGASSLLGAIATNKNIKLQTLNLAKNNIDSIVPTIIDQLFTDNRSLETLILDNNPLSLPNAQDTTLPIIFKALANNRSLTKLSLKQVNLTSHSIDILIQTLSKNQTLRELDLGRIDDSLAKRISEGIPKTSQLQIHMESEVNHGISLLA
ncbi:MAG TPA: hypothetical protein VJN02_06545 [Gammaproteobacteria bacterium]|nr:hypothetical protein [Gammaproteobacteria bacterium]